MQFLDAWRAWMPEKGAQQHIDRGRTQHRIGAPIDPFHTTRARVRTLQIVKRRQMVSLDDVEGVFQRDSYSTSGDNSLFYCDSDPSSTIHGMMCLYRTSM